MAKDGFFWQYVHHNSKLLVPVVYFADPVYVPFGQTNMRSTLHFCPRTARKEMNVEKLKSYCANIYTVVLKKAIRISENWLMLKQLNNNIYPQHCLSVYYATATM